MRTWQPNDKEWLKARKAEWKYVKSSIDEMGEIKTKGMKSVKRYFLQGDLPEKEDSRYIFSGNLLLLKMWFHPDDSTENMQRLIGEVTKRHEEDLTISLFFKYVNGPYKFSPPYYMMGGREKAIARALVPSHFSMDLIREYDPNMKMEVARLNAGISPNGFVNNFFRTLYWFMTPNESNPYVAYQYLTDYFESCCQYLGEDLELNKGRGELAGFFTALRDFDVDDMPENKKQNTERLYQKLMEALKEGRLGPVINRLYNEFDWKA